MNSQPSPLSHFSPLTMPSAKIPKKARVLRTHSGCKTCRRRSKKCDEAKPVCQACARLSLKCSYGVDYTFRSVIMHHGSSDAGPKESLDLLPILTQTPEGCEGGPTPVRRQRSDLTSPGNQSIVSTPDGLSLQSQLCLYFKDLLEARYFQHFENHVRDILPASFQRLAKASPQSPVLTSALLCLSASNLSMLDASVQSRHFSGERMSVFSPVANPSHHQRAGQYHDLTIEYSVFGGETLDILVARVLLAYYHHASTSHLAFRAAVWNCMDFVLRHRDNILSSPGGPEALQLWFRLCTSHRPAKLPALLLDGEGPSCFGPNLDIPGIPGSLHLSCVLGMNADDLIYDILVRTLELRSRMVVFHCIGGVCQVSPESAELSTLVHVMMNDLLGRACLPAEHAEVRAGYVRGHHLVALLESQRSRLQIWASRLTPEKLLDASTPQYTRHQDAMNTIYYHLCELMIEESHLYVPQNADSPLIAEKENAMAQIVQKICCVVESLDLTVSNVSDVYTYSLAEVLQQLVSSWHSKSLFNYVLDVIWPRLESHGRGFEHSHYPTHLAKRTIAYCAEEHLRGRKVTFAIPAVTERLPKLSLLNIDHTMALVVCGHDLDGRSFLEKTPLS